jgi:hypothetical protein
VFEPEWETEILGEDTPRPGLILVPAASLMLHAQFGAVAMSSVNAERRLVADTAKVTVAAAGFGVAAETAPGVAAAGGQLTYTAAEQMSAAKPGVTFVVDAAELAVLS